VSGTERDTGSLYGFSLLNDSKYSFDVNVRDIGMTVLRSPIHAHHDPMVPDPDTHYSYIDQGIQRFAYSLLPHPGGWEEANTVKRAAELNAPPVALIATFHDGPLPQRGSFLEVSSKSVVASMLKEAEDGDALIMRLYETQKTAAEATLTLPTLGRSFTASFGPCEIKTFRIPRAAEQEVTEVNLLEWDV
jgi:alpha-mannosidase